MTASRLLPRWTDDDLDGWRSEATPQVRPSPASRLSALRRGFYEETIAARAARRRQVGITTYVLARDDMDTDAVRAQLLAYAEHMQWRVGSEYFTDRPSPGQADARPALTGACRYAASGYVDGILVADREALTLNAKTYEATLRWLHDRCAFIAFVPPGIRGTS